MEEPLHIPIIKRLLATGADPNASDGEPGWSSLHEALHFGHLAVASILLRNEASVAIEDSKSRTPVDLQSGPVVQSNGNGDGSVTELYSWGSGVNYQLGTGNAHIQKLPCKVDAHHGSFIKLISSAKFHSVVVNAHAEVYTWGFGRGGRLGHPDLRCQQFYSLCGKNMVSICAGKYWTPELHHLAMFICGDGKKKKDVLPL